MFVAKFLVYAITAGMAAMTKRFTYA